MSRLEPIIGVEIIDGDIRMGHTWYEAKKLANIISLNFPKHFVEIGVHEGGLSKTLIEKYQGRLHYVGIEYDCGLVRPQVRQLFNETYNSELWCGDCFSQEILDKVFGLEGKKIVYCDGGHKAQELMIYSKLMNSGDLILSHDFSDGNRYGEGLPEEIHAEVFPSDVEFLDHDPKFTRILDQLLVHTRIVGYFVE